MNIFSLKAVFNDELFCVFLCKIDFIDKIREYLTS